MVHKLIDPHPNYYGPQKQYIPQLGAVIETDKDILAVNLDAEFLYNNLG